MLQLDTAFSLTPANIRSPNLCDQFSDEDLVRIGSECATGYANDEFSRFTWLRRNEAGMDLALQVQKDKSFPWAGCANVAFPLVTIAALQFHAKAYPAIVDGPNVVKCCIFGRDDTGEMTAHADRVETHMSWQLLYEDRPWEEQEDKAIFNLSIVGTNFKKSYFSASLNHNVSELVLAKDLVLNYWAKSVEDCPRKTQRIPRFRNEVYENVMRGIWKDVLEEAWYKSGNPTVQAHTTQIMQDNRQGVTPPPPDPETSFIFLEQHVNIDLDNDGYAEPYIITFEENSKCVVRIVTRFNSEKDIERVLIGANKGKIIKIRAMEYFTAKIFIPSPDGGIYGLGFGVFLGPLNEAVNSIVNMLLDCGTLQTTGGGFLGRGAKIRGGQYTVAPFEWKRVDSTGDDLRKSIFPLPVNQPSDVLFQLLGLLIDYTNRVAGTTDTQVGQNPGQNTPAETMRTMTEMGQKIYTAIFKRIWRSWKEEFRKLYLLNGLFLVEGKTYVGGATKADYLGEGEEIAPIADPNIISESARQQQALMIKQAAASTPGYNHDAAERRFLKAFKVENIEEIFPGTQGQPPAKDPKLQIAETKEEGANMRQQAELQARQQEFVFTLMEERRVNNAEIVKLEAQAQESTANAQSEEAYAQIGLLNTQLSVAKHRDESINAQIDHMLRAIESRNKYMIEMKKLSQPAKKAA